MKRFILIAGIMLAIVIAQAHAQQGTIPPLINYQGTLTDANGNLLTGTKKLEINLYDAVEGGSKVWGPQIFSNVPLIKGMFNVIIGPNDTANRSIADAFGAGNRFLGIKIDDGQEIVPRQQILSTPFAINCLNSIPKGTVVAWYGNIGSIPNGWALCDGTNGTPDLRNRFLVGAGDEYAVNATGGEKAHALTLGEMPAHAHTYNRAVEGGRYDGHSSVVFNTYVSDNTSSVGGGQPHENRPPYFALIFIMKI